MPISGRNIEKDVFERFVLEQNVSVGLAFDSLPTELRNAAQQESPALFKLAEADIKEQSSACQQIERMRADEFLSASGIKDDDTFDRQRFVEMHASDYNFFAPKMLPPQRTGKIMNDEMYLEAVSYFKDLFGDRLHYLSKTFNKFARCRVNGTGFNSMMNRSDRSSYAKVYCAVNVDEQPQPYYCQLEFFFTMRAIIRRISACLRKLV